MEYKAGVCILSRRVRDSEEFCKSDLPMEFYYPFQGACKFQDLHKKQVSSYGPSECTGTFALSIMWSLDSDVL